MPYSWQNIEMARNINILHDKLLRPDMKKKRKSIDSWLIFANTISLMSLDLWAVVWTMLIRILIKWS